jgi:hypothetical protein
MTNSAWDCILRTIGQEIWEVQITAETAGDTLLDVPTYTTKKHRIYGVFRVATKELLELVGTSLQGDAVLFTNEQLDLTSQIEVDDVTYEIEEELKHNYYLANKGYSYILRRKGARITSS